MIVGVPNYDLIEYAEQKVKEYDIKLAIHNHGPEDALYQYTYPFLHLNF